MGKAAAACYDLIFGMIISGKNALNGVSCLMDESVPSGEFSDGGYALIVRPVGDTFAQVPFSGSLAVY